MTKVKTILAEFCSPKDILAINRLGLLKKEERESQPIPWRHRLPNAERRELVKSEMRMSIRPDRSRVNTRDKFKAYETASNPKDSRMGVCLYNIHIRGDPSLSSSISKIQRERSRLEASQRHTQQQFMSRSHILNHEPLLLVERTPSPVVRTRATLMKQHGVDPQTLLKPSYMRPLQAHARSPSTLTTIDAFAAETKKKRNVWEEAMDEREPPKFKSTARPCTRLTRSEMQQLRLGHALHKPPRPEPGKTTPSDSIPNSSSRKSPKLAKGEQEMNDTTQNQKDSVFITQQHDKEKDSVSFRKPPQPKSSRYTESSSNLGKLESKQHDAPSNTKTVRFSGVRSSSAGGRAGRRPSPNSPKGGLSGTKKPRPLSETPRSASFVVAKNVGLTRKQGVVGIVGPTSFDKEMKNAKDRKTKKSMDFLSSILET